jgi:DNA polymerase-1
MRLAGAEGWDEQTSQRAIDEYFKVYRSIPTYMDSCRAEARRNGFVRDRWGRIRYLPGVYSDIARIRQEALRQSHSFKISASAQGIIKRAMAGIWKWLRECWAEKLTIEPLLQIHDELLFEMNPEMWPIADAAIADMLCNTTALSVPIKAKGSMGANWGVLKD